MLLCLYVSPFFLFSICCDIKSPATIRKPELSVFVNSKYLPKSALTILSLAVVVAAGGDGFIVCTVSDGPPASGLLRKSAKNTRIVLEPKKRIHIFWGPVWSRTCFIQTTRDSHLIRYVSSPRHQPLMPTVNLRMTTLWWIWIVQYWQDACLLFL